MTLRFDVTPANSASSTTSRRGRDRLGLPTSARLSTLPAPIGTVGLVGDDVALYRVLLPGSFDETEPPDAVVRDEDANAEAKRELAAYFAGELVEFDLVVAPIGTQFQLLVWRALADIAFGATESYGSLARRIGNPRASRAVGMANNRNPLALVLPCHRVIGSSGRLVGYGGGLEMKKWLLDHEQAVLAPDAPATRLAV